MDTSQLLTLLTSSLWHRKWAAMFTFLVTLTLVLVGIAVCPRTYRSEAKLFVRVGRESVTLDPTATTGQTIAVQSSREIEVRSIRDMLESRVLLEKIVEKLGAEYILYPPRGPIITSDVETSPRDSTSTNAAAESVADIGPTPFERFESKLSELVEQARTYARQVRLSDPVPADELAVKKLAQSLSVDGGTKSSIILLEMKSKSPQAAQRILQTFLDVYRELHVRVNRAQENYAFFANQTERLHDQLQQARQRMQIAKDQQGLVSIEVRKTNLQDQISNIEQQIRSIQARLSGTDAALAATNRRLADIPARLMTDEVSAGDPATDTMRPQLFDLEIAAERAKVMYSEDHPERIRVMAQLASAQKIYDTQTKIRPTKTSTINRSHQELELLAIQTESQRESILAELTALESQRDAMRETLRSLNASEVELAELQTQVDLLEASHREYAENLELSRIDEELRKEQISNVGVVQEPSLIYLPVTPNKKLLGAAGGCLAMLNAVGMAVWRDRRRWRATPNASPSTAAIVVTPATTPGAPESTTPPQQAQSAN
jgi:uncharacterized protein involved in exopolysaccharide biosynthesis